MSKPQIADSIEQRKQALTHWVSQQIQAHPALATLNGPAISLESLGSDAGFRRYYRFNPQLNSQPPLLAVDAPPASEDTELFTLLAHYLRKQGINAPAVLAADSEQGFLLVENFGDRLLQDELTPDAACGLYGEALMTLLRLQQATDIPESLPGYDQAMLRRELEIFSEWFVVGLLGYTLNEQEYLMLDTCFAHLEASALEQPQVLVHRDYHSRNLMVCDSGSLGVIDFQGAVRGPFSYDLASLLRDCYVRWPAAEVKRWALGYGNMAMEVGILPEVNEADYLRWFDWMGLQRHIKVLGIFARLHLRDGKPQYLTDLPLVIRYTLEVASDYPQLADFAHWFEQKLLPLAQTQSWYSDYRTAGEHA